MISKKQFDDAVSLIDEKYIVQAATAGEAVEAAEAVGTVETGAAANAGTATQGQTETNVTRRNSTGRRRAGAGARSAIIAAVLIVAGAAAGIAITLGVRQRGNPGPVANATGTPGAVISDSTPGGSTGVVNTAPAPVGSADVATAEPTAPLPEGCINASELIDRIYADSADPAVSNPAGLPTLPPGARNDVSTLRRASDALVGDTLTVRINYMESDELLAAEPVFVLFRDTAGGAEADSGTVVLMISKNVYGNDAVPQLVTEIRSVLIAGRTDNISQLLQLDSNAISCYFGPVTVEQVSIISALDHMYPRQAVYAAMSDAALNYSNLYAYPLYTLVSDGESMVKKPVVSAASVGLLTVLGTGMIRPMPYYVDAGTVDLAPLLETFARFGLTYPERGDSEGEQYAEHIHNTGELLEAFLLGYPDFAAAKLQFDFSFRWTLRSSIRRTEDGIPGTGVEYTYLFKFADEAVIVRTPVLFDTKYKGADGLNELGYYVSFGGQRYSCASAYVPLTNGNYEGNFTNWQRLGDAERALIADGQVFTVEHYPLSEYDALAELMRSASSRETLDWATYMKQYESEAAAARNNGEPTAPTPTPFTTTAPPTPTPTPTP